MEDVQQESVKRVVALTLQAEMDAKKISKVAMATRLQTSRPALDRILNPFHRAITLATIEKVAKLLGKKVVIQFLDKEDSAHNISH